MLRPLFPCCALFRFTFLILISFVCGDIHLDPGLKRIRCFYNFSICHWNLNSITAHNHGKINLLKSYNTVKKFGLICISKWCLDSSISSDSEKLSIGGWNHSDNVRRGGLYVHIFVNLCPWVVHLTCIWMNV